MDPNVEPVKFCIVEDTKVKSIHYPIEDGNKGDPGYISFVGYERDSDVVEQACASYAATVFNL